MGAPIFPEIWVRGVPIFRGTHISMTPVISARNVLNNSLIDTLKG